MILYKNYTDGNGNTVKVVVLRDANAGDTGFDVNQNQALIQLQNASTLVVAKSTLSNSNDQQFPANGGATEQWPPD